VLDIGLCYAATPVEQAPAHVGKRSIPSPPVAATESRFAFGASEARHHVFMRLAARATVACTPAGRPSSSSPRSVQWTRPFDGVQASDDDAARYSWSRTRSWYLTGQRAVSPGISASYRERAVGHDPSRIVAEEGEVASTVPMKQFAAARGAVRSLGLEVTLSRSHSRHRHPCSP